ncbi:MAG: Ig-like domain-containing protein [Actinomycetota bacterium]|nr:Ig-like domain-containing protein [Actinomycetota bacterium]
MARDDRAVTGPGRPVTVPVTANDADRNDPFVAGDLNRPGDPPTVAGVGTVTPAGAGAATCDGRSCTFSPAPGFIGAARFTYTLVDKGVPPQSGQAVVEVWVDPDQPALTGFSGDESADVTASTATWAPTTQVVASGLCADGRPRVAVTWQPVERATGYRVERRAGDASTDAWVEVAVVAGGATAWSDDRVGEGRTFGYRVTPVRHRWAGQPSAAAGVTTPAPSGPTGC